MRAYREILTIPGAWQFTTAALIARLLAERMVRLADEGVIRAIDGTDVRVDARSICVHGDSPGSIAMAAETKRMLHDAGITIAPFASAPVAGV